MTKRYVLVSLEVLVPADNRYMPSEHDGRLNVIRGAVQRGLDSYGLEPIVLADGGGILTCRDNEQCCCVVCKEKMLRTPA